MQKRMIYLYQLKYLVECLNISLLKKIITISENILTVLNKSFFYIK